MGHGLGVGGRKVVELLSGIFSLSLGVADSCLLDTMNLCSLSTTSARSVRA